MACCNRPQRSYNRRCGVLQPATRSATMGMRCSPSPPLSLACLRFESMADGDGGGGEGGGSAEWQPIYDRVQAQAEALAADRTLLEAASKVQRESWEAARRLQRSVEELQAAAREKDAENGRLREEAADASKKLVEVRQAGASRRMRWEAAYVELLLGANQKLAELRDGDMEDYSRICAETPNSKEVESCAKLSQSTADQARVANDLGTELRKLKQAYETLSSKKDQEVSALLSEKELARNQLVVMQKDYDALLMNKKRETSQATEAAQKLQQSVDDLKVSAQKKDDEIGRLRAEAVAAEKTLQKMQSLVKEKDDEIERLKGGLPRTIRKRKNMNNQMVEHVSEIKTVEKDGQAGTCQKRKRASSLSNVVHFWSLEKTKEEDFCLQMPKTFTYDEVVKEAAQQLGVDDPSKIRLTSHNCYSQQPKRKPIKYRGVARLLDMLVHYYQTSDILYYEVLDISLRELKTLKVTYHHATKDEVSVHSMILSQNSMVGDVLSDIKSKVELSHPDAELRLHGILYHKICAILRPGIDKIECIPDQYWTLHAEETPEEEKNLGPFDRLIQVCHFTIDNQSRTQVQNFGKPYFMVIHADETLSSIKERLQKKLKVSDKDFSKWKFAHILRDHPDYFEDSDTVATKFQKNIGCWDQYLGLEHPDTAPRKAHSDNQFCCLRRRCQRMTSTA